MGKDEIILSICIPTYNRAEKLDRLLSSVQKEIAGSVGQVEVCISDNCSSDGTPQVVGKWEKLLPVVKSRNIENFGLDVNFAKVVMMASGKFAWLMGDDDVLEGGAVKRLIASLSSEDARKAGAVYVNALVKGRPMARFGFESFSVFKKDSRECAPINASFAGSLCLRREIAQKIISTKTRMEGTRLAKLEGDPDRMDYFAPAFLFLECVNDGGFFGVEPSPCVRIVADGDMISYEKKIYLDVTLNLYALEARRHYPWFNEGAKNYNIKSFLVGAAIAAERPALAEGVEVSRWLYYRLLMSEGRGKNAAYLAIAAKILAIPPFSFAAIAGFRVARSVLKMSISEKAPCGGHLEKSLAFSIGRAKKFLEEEKKAAAGMQGR